MIEDPLYTEWTYVCPKVFSFAELGTPCTYWSNGRHIVFGEACRCGKEFVLVQAPPPPPPPNLDRRCNWCEKPMLFHAAFAIRWHGLLTWIARIPPTYEAKPVYTRDKD